MKIGEKNYAIIGVNYKQKFRHSNVILTKIEILQTRILNEMKTVQPVAAQYISLVDRCHETTFTIQVLAIVPKPEE